ncbi:GNAT family N-acetyltransferase [Nereida sp.]|uniref:GNAT family N-acetyltransferase n=1 Tax=Nereida sp. TaxID=2736090 RepID=UPI003F698E77
MQSNSQVAVRLAREADFTAWNGLYEDYADFYGVPQTQEMRDRVWSWCHDPSKSTKYYVAETAEGQLIGLAHMRPFERPLAASIGGFLDDLYVDEAARGSGAGRALILHLQSACDQRGWGVLRWITAPNNAAARALYDSLASMTEWLTYDLDV